MKYPNNRPWNFRDPTVETYLDQVETKSRHLDFGNLDSGALDDFYAYQNVGIMHGTDSKGFRVFDGAPGDLGDQFQPRRFS